MTRKEKRAKKQARKQLVKPLVAVIAQPISVGEIHSNETHRTEADIQRSDLQSEGVIGQRMPVQAYIPGAYRIVYTAIYEGKIRGYTSKFVDKIGDNLWEYENNSHTIYVNRGGGCVIYLKPSPTARILGVAHTLPLWTTLLPEKRLKQRQDSSTPLHATAWWPHNKRVIELERRTAERQGVLVGTSVIPLPLYVQRHVSTQIGDGIFFPLPQKFKKKPGTGAHLSTIDDRLIAYYPTPRHQRALLAQRIKPGKYLKKYFPEMSDDEIRVMANRVSAGTELKFFSKGEDMIKYYMALSKEGVVSSCMSKLCWVTHPLMAYDNSDVELAVLFSGGEPVARAVYNKHNKHYPMVYGQWERMKPALDHAGFIHADLIGAKLNKIEIEACKKAYLMPYIDGHRELSRTSAKHAYVTIYDDYIEVTATGIAANRYEHGFIYPDLDDDDDDDDMCTCVHCDDHIRVEDSYEDELTDNSVCSSCWGEYAISVYLNGARNPVMTTQAPEDEDFIYIEGMYYIDSDAAEYHGWRLSNYEEQYIHQDYAEWSTTEDTYVSNDNPDFFLCDNGEVYLVRDAIDNAYFDVERLAIIWEENEDTIPLEYLRSSEHFEEYAREMDPRLVNEIPEAKTQLVPELEQAFTMDAQEPGAVLAEIEQRAAALPPHVRDNPQQCGDGLRIHDTPDTLAH
jgi:hypothetical protein